MADLASRPIAAMLGGVAVLGIVAVVAFTAGRRGAPEAPRPEGSEPDATPEPAASPLEEPPSPAPAPAAPRAFRFATDDATVERAARLEIAKEPDIQTLLRHGHDAADIEKRVRVRLPRTMAAIARHLSRLNQVADLGEAAGYSKDAIELARERLAERLDGPDLPTTPEARRTFDRNVEYWSQNAAKRELLYADRLLKGTQKILNPSPRASDR